MRPESRVRDFASGHFSTKPMDIPTVALILELLNSQENCSSESQKVSLLQLQRLLSFSWICSDKSYNFPFPHSKAEGGLKTQQQYPKAQTHRSGQQRPEPSGFPSLSFAKSRTESRQGEREMVATFGQSQGILRVFTSVHLKTGRASRCSLAIAKCLSLRSESATPFMAWLCPKFMLPEQTWSVSPICLHAVSVAVFTPLKNRYSKCYTTTPPGALVCLGAGVYVCA